MASTIYGFACCLGSRAGNGHALTHSTPGEHWEQRNDCLSVKVACLYVDDSQKEGTCQACFFPVSPRIDDAVSVSKYLNRFNSHKRVPTVIYIWTLLFFLILVCLASLRRNNWNASLGVLRQNSRKLWHRHNNNSVASSEPGIRADIQFRGLPRYTKVRSSKLFITCHAEKNITVTNLNWDRKLVKSS